MFNLSPEFILSALSGLPVLEFGVTGHILAGVLLRQLREVVLALACAAPRGVERRSVGRRHSSKIYKIRLMYNSLSHQFVKPNYMSLSQP